MRWGWDGLDGRGRVGRDMAWAEILFSRTRPLLFPLSSPHAVLSSSSCTSMEFLFKQAPANSTPFLVVERSTVKQINFRLTAQSNKHIKESTYSGIINTTIKKCK